MGTSLSTEFPQGGFEGVINGEILINKSGAGWPPYPWHGHFKPLRPVQYAPAEVYTQRWSKEVLTGPAAVDASARKPKPSEVGTIGSFDPSIEANQQLEALTRITGIYPESVEMSDLELLDALGKDE